jgi:hypothetical protein
LFSQKLTPKDAPEWLPLLPLCPFYPYEPLHQGKDLFQLVNQIHRLSYIFIYSPISRMVPEVENLQPFGENNFQVELIFQAKNKATSLNS